MEKYLIKVTHPAIVKVMYLHNISTRLTTKETVRDFDYTTCRQYVHKENAIKWLNNDGMHWVWNQNSQKETIEHLTGRQFIHALLPGCTIEIIKKGF